LIEDKAGTFYDSGSARLSASGQELLELLGSELKTLPNNLLIEGHTDATPYSNDESYSNWELSADRANSARRLLQQDGVRKDQVTQVRGYADQFLRVKSNPNDPSNRRISILVKNDDASIPTYTADSIVSGKTKLPDAGKPAAPAGGAKPAEGAKAAEGGKPVEGAKPAGGESKPAEAPAAAPPPAAPAQQPAAKPAAPAAKPGLMDKIKGIFGGKK
jgi:chemotaxis protein MotB